MLGTAGDVVELEAGGLGRRRGSGWPARDPKVEGGCRQGDRGDGAGRCSWMDGSIENSGDWPALKTRRVAADGMDGRDKLPRI